MLAIGIGIQNFPEGAAVSLPLRNEGFSRFKSFMLGQASALVEPIAAVIGVVLREMLLNFYFQERRTYFDDSNILCVRTKCINKQSL